MFEITRKHCYKRDLEMIIVNNSQYFWINLKDFEVETERNWQNIFNKYGNSSILKYRKELTPNIQFQPDRIFVTNDLFERIIKSCKATNVEFSMLKEKLGICTYGVICDEQEITLIPETQDGIEELKKETKESIKIKISEESTEESTKELTEESIEIKSPKENENTTDWYDKNKFKKILDVVGSNKFNHKNKIGKLKYNGIKNLVDNINKNAIRETLAKENIHALNELKNAEIKKKRLISNQKELLNLFDDLLETISDNNNNNNNSESENESENENKNKNEDENENVYEIKEINNYFKMIDESKSFEDQIKLLQKTDYLDECWNMNYYDDNKELNLKIFKLKFEYLSNDIDENFFEEVFGHTFVALANKLINTTNKEENKIIVNDVKKNIDILYEHDSFNNFVIQPGHKRIGLIDTAKLILEFNETIQSDLV